jgi:methionyl-tRNA formyltransferase
MLRIAFAGTPQFALPTLQTLAASSHRLVGVITQPDRPAGRGRQLQPSPVKQLALQLALSVLQPPRLAGESAVLQQLAAWAADLLVVVAYGLILPRPLLQLPRLGCVNIHASLLPRWRGAAPVQHAILAGDEQTGVTLMRMEAGLDSGPIISQHRVPIGPQTTAGELEEMLAHEGARLLLDSLEALEGARCELRPQGEHGITYAAKFDRHAAQIDWAGPAVQIERQVRAFNPRPVAYTLWQGEPLRIWQARLVGAAEAAGAPSERTPREGALPGTVLGLHREELWIECGDRETLALQCLQLPGRRPITGREFAQGRVLPGARLGS